MRSYDIGSRIDNMCRLYCVDMKEMEILGKSMLKLFRDVCRGNADSAEELLADLCSDSGESDELRRINESVVRLQFFTQDARRAVYEDSIQTVIETGTMLRIMDAIKAKLYNGTVRLNS